MVSSVTLMLLALLQSAGSTTPPSGQPPPADATRVDPATLSFPSGTSGLVLVLVKADRVADYEAVITALTTALAAASPEARTRAGGWQVFKAQEPDAKGNAVYVHWLPTPSPGTDYRPSAALEALMVTLPEATLVKYREALAAAPSRLTLAMLAELALGRLPKPPG